MVAALSVGPLGQASNNTKAGSCKLYGCYADRFSRIFVLGGSSASNSTEARSR